ncbi:MAG: ATPase [Kiritimatiellae bacterium]|nr:ATPase [Kiritimatiellia bacterium]MCO5061919.1 ATPase [Kiritimatiellia bacterium]MCO6401438.1 ATPase [Verrucomicrobiota bacterium]
MAEELQHLIERIQKEAVDTGERQAAELVSNAKKQAAALIAEAEKQAQARLEKADRDAQQYTERSLQTLKQAARDVLITVGQGVENVVGSLASDAANAALDEATVQQMLVKLAEGYAGRTDRERSIEMLVSKEDQQKLINFFQAKYQERLQTGLTIRGDERVLKGFKISMDGGRVSHDFTPEAIAEALSNFLRPHLAEVVNRVAREGGAK